MNVMKADYMKSNDYAKLFVNMTYENALAVKVSLETGLRIGDVLKIKPEDIRGRTISFVAEKTGKKGKAVVSQDTANRLRQVAGEFYVWEKRGKPREHRTRQTVWKDVKKSVAALRAAGVVGYENITVHSARKTFAVEDAEKHGLEHTRRVLQHRDKNTTKLYAFSDRYTDGLETSKKIDYILLRIGNLETILSEIRKALDIPSNDGL